MKKYLSIAALFLLNNEVISWIALTIICGVALWSFVKAVCEYDGR